MLGHPLKLDRAQKPPLLKNTFTQRIYHLSSTTGDFSSFVFCWDQGEKSFEKNEKLFFSQDHIAQVKQS